MSNLNFNFDLTGAFIPNVIVLNDASPVIDASKGNSFLLETSGSVTIPAPINSNGDSQMIVIRVYATGGSCTVSLNETAGGFRFGSDITGLSTTAEGTFDYITAIRNDSGDDAFWDVVSYVKGYAA